jgi:hypothetical protein
MEDSLLLQIFFSFPHLSRQCRLGQKNSKYSPPHPIHPTNSSPSAHAVHTSPSVQIVPIKKRSDFFIFRSKTQGTFLFLESSTA